MQGQTLPGADLLLTVVCSSSCSWLREESTSSLARVDYVRDACASGQIAVLNTMFLAQVLHTASNGGCRVVVGRSLADGGVYTVADIGRESSQEANSAAEASSSRNDSSEQQQDEVLRVMHFATVKLRPGIDTVILGSQGLWYALTTILTMSSSCPQPSSCTCPCACSAKPAGTDTGIFGANNLRPREVSWDCMGPFRAGIFVDVCGVLAPQA